VAAPSRGLEGVLPDVDEGLLELRPVGGHRAHLRRDLHLELDPLLLRPRAQERGHCPRHDPEVARAETGGREAHDVREAPCELLELPEARHHDGERLLEVPALPLGQARAVVQAGLEERAAGPDRVADLVGHHPHDLLVGRLLRLSQLLGQLLEKQERSGEAAVEEAPPVAAHAAGAGERDDHRFTRGQGGQRLGERSAYLVEPQPGERSLGAAEELPGRGVREGDLPIEVQDDDAGGRPGQDAREEPLLLLVPRPLLAQLVRHPVVDADQAVHLGLPDLAEARREVALREEARGLLERLEPAPQAAQQGESGEERHREHRLDRQQPDAILPQQDPRDHREERVEGEEVGQEASRDAQPELPAHTSIPYFWRRR
jgi:hypothetical protein